jgi:hypothetical protein
MKTLGKLTALLSAVAIISMTAPAVFAEVTPPVLPDLFGGSQDSGDTTSTGTTPPSLGTSGGTDTSTSTTPPSLGTSGGTGTNTTGGSGGSGGSGGASGINSGSSSSGSGGSGSVIIPGSGSGSSSSSSSANSSGSGTGTGTALNQGLSETGPEAVYALLLGLLLSVGYMRLSPKASRHR